MANETIEVLRIPGTLFPRGAFDENASYKFLNIVESGGSGYVCLQPCTGIPVTNTAYWFKFVFKGDKGDAFTYADLTAEQKAELVRDATAAAQAAASSAQSAADDAAAALQKFNTIKAAIDAIDPQSTEGSIQTLAAKQGVLEAELDVLGPKIGDTLLFELMGQGTTYVSRNISNWLPGHTYRLWLDDWDIDPSTSSSSFVFTIKKDNNVLEGILYRDFESKERYYDVVVESGSVYNIGGRAANGSAITLHIEDITSLSEVRQDVDEQKEEIRGAAKVVTCGGINFDNTNHRVSIETLIVANQSNNNRLTINPAEVDYAFSSGSTTVWWFVYDLNTSTYTFVSAGTITRKQIAIASLLIQGSSSATPNTSKVNSVQWSAILNYKIDGTSQVELAINADKGLLLMNSALQIDNTAKTISLPSGSDLLYRTESATKTLLAGYSLSYANTTFNSSLYYLIYNYDSGVLELKIYAAFTTGKKYPIVCKIATTYNTNNIIGYYDNAVGVVLDGKILSADEERAVKVLIAADSSLLDIELKSKFRLHYTHNGTGSYAASTTRNAITSPLHYDSAITVSSDGSHDFAIQFFDGYITGSAHLIQATAWVNSYTIPSGSYWCMIVRNNNNSETTQGTTDALLFSGIKNTSVISEMKERQDELFANKPYSYYGDSIRFNRFNVRSFKTLSNTWAQSMAIYKDYVVFFSNETNKAQLYKISTATLLATFDIPNGGYFQPHCNTAMVGVEFASNDSIMPVIYLSQWDAGHERACFVLDVAYANEEYAMTLVQKINLSAISSSIIGVGECDFAVDRVKNMLYAIAYKTSVYTAQGTSTMVCKIALPLLSAGSEVLVTDSDVISNFETTLIKYRQDAFMWDDNIYIASGGLSSVPASLFVINTYKQQITTEIPLSSYQAGEPECLDLYDDSKMLYNYGSNLLEIVV